MTLQAPVKCRHLHPFAGSHDRMTIVTLHFRLHVALVTERNGLRDRRARGADLRGLAPRR